MSRTKTWVEDPKVLAGGWSKEDPRFYVYKLRRIIVVDTVRDLVFFGEAECKHGYSVMLSHPREDMRCVGEGEAWPDTLIWCFQPARFQPDVQVEGKE